MAGVSDGPWRQTSLRLPPDLYDWLTEKARAERRSFNNLVVWLLSRIREEEQGQARPPT
jgi:hypothetical protein